MKKTLFITLLAALCSFGVPENADQLVLNAANSKLTFFLQKIPKGQESAYGFTTKDAVEDCTLNKPIRTVTFSQEFYSDQLLQGMESIVPQNEWRVPVSLGSRDRALLTVNSAPQGYMANAIGGSVLAAELQQVSAGVSRGENIYLLRIYPLFADFFVHTAGKTWEDAQFVPLTSARMAIPSLADGNKAVYTLTDVQNMVKGAISKSNR